MRIITCLLAVFWSLQLVANDGSLEGTWKGVLYRKGQDISKGTVFYLQVDGKGKDVNGITREEGLDTEFFSVKKYNGEMDGNQLTFNHVVEIKSKKGSRMKWCRFSATLKYNEETGYLSGGFVSTDCRNILGNIVLFKEDFTVSKTEEKEISQLWFTQFLKDYREGLNAPMIRKIERDNFVFEPIYFDFDKFEIREEHHEFLNAMIKIVKGHSDLRVKVTGHTDSDGSHMYNDTLSMNRAKSIIKFFTDRGLDADRIEIDFKGEMDPVSTNDTSQGKQLNRRVDFEFI